MDRSELDGFARAGDSLQADQSLPIFDVQRVQLRFDLSTEFAAAQVANNILILALASGRILRFDLDNAQDIDDIDLPKKPSEIGLIRRLFLDPSASHLLISTTLGDNFYLHAQSRQPKALSRLKGVQIECVAWNPAQPTTSTREILVGASDGNIYETFVEPSTEFYRREEKFVKHVYKSQHGTLVGIWLDTVEQAAGKLVRVLIATPTRTLRYVGRSGKLPQDSSGSIYTRLFESEAPTVHDVARLNDASTSAFALSPDTYDGPTPRHQNLTERAIGWLCEKGAYCGTLPNSQSMLSEQQVFNDAKMIALTKLLGSSTGVGSAGRTISSLALTDFHVLALVGLKLVAVNRLDETIIYDQKVLEHGQVPLGLFSDRRKGTLWLFTRQDIYEVVITDEARDIWKIMLANKDLDAAAKFASTPEQKDAVAVASGDHLVACSRFAEAAAVYGISTKPFEDVALAFIDHDQRDALRKYLLVKLSSLKKNETMQRILVASWLVELFMAKLNQLDDSISAKAATSKNGSTAPTEDLSATRSEYQDFVKKYKSDLDGKTTYSLINSHGREEEMLFFANAVEDYSYVLSYWVERERWAEAMSILMKQTDPDIFYRYSNVLMEHAPADFIDVVMRQANLDATKFIPALLNYDRTARNTALSQNQAVRYLLFVINRQQSRDTSIHNTLISVYASHSTTDESALLTYLRTQTDAEEQNYDPDFAIRLCTANNCIQSCVHIYCTLSRYDAAVGLALAHKHLELAASVANRPENDLALRKKLWLKVAKQVISDSHIPGGGGIKSAMEFLKRCNNGVASGGGGGGATTSEDELLRIEDLIPFFPDFVVIDDFKEEICDALETYSRQIDALRQEMDDSVDTARNIKLDIKLLDQRYAVVEPGERCWICRLPLLMKQFFVFPCQHSFHAECLGKMVCGIAGPVKGRRIKELQSEIGRGMVQGVKREKLVAELDGLVAASCVLCSEMAVKMIDEPFITDLDDKNEWAI